MVHPQPLSRTSIALVLAVATSFPSNLITAQAPVSGGGSGRTVADSGFRPKPNGFGFENWSGDRYPISNLTADDAAALFGDRVCARFKGESCEPTAAAKLWIEEMNRLMQGGRCEGMAALSAAFHVKEETVGDYGAKQAFELQPKDADFMRTISTYFVTQALEPVQSGAAETRTWSLQRIVENLISSLSARKDYLTLGIYGAEGGHAVTPYMVEDRGAGVFRVFVYDNNYPGAEKFIDIDTVRNRWSYAAAALNPSEDVSPWEGGAGTMDLTPLSLRYEALECPFCGDHVAPVRPQGKAPEHSPRKPSVASSDYIVFAPNRCSEIRATRKKDGQQLSPQKSGGSTAIGGASMVALRGARGCVVRLPKDERYDVALVSDGRPSHRPTTELAVFSPGNVYAVSNVSIVAGKEQIFSFDDDRISYLAGGAQQPTLRIAGDRAGRNTIYEVSGFTLSDGRTFGATEDDTGKVTFHDDDPNLDVCDISAEVIDEDGAETIDLADIDLGDNGQVSLDVDESGALDVALDSDGDGTPNETDSDDDNDGAPDQADTDDDNDGVTDVAEGGDADGDSIPDTRDLDDDNDGTPDVSDSSDANEGGPEGIDAADEMADTTASDDSAAAAQVDDGVDGAEPESDAAEGIPADEPSDSVADGADEDETVEEQAVDDQPEELTTNAEPTDGGEEATADSAAADEAAASEEADNEEAVSEEADSEAEAAPESAEDSADDEA